MDGVNEPDENGKISNLLAPDAKNKPLNKSRKTGQTLGTKMAFYSRKKLPQSLIAASHAGIFRLMFL
ncbi:hypothetical protein Hanom_Chr07g00668661 [Helianthus anomalus]